MGILLVAAAVLVVGAGAYVSLRLPLLVLTLYVATVPFGSAVSLPLSLPPPFDTPSSVLGFLALVVLVVDAAIGGRRRRAALGAPHAWFVAFVGVCALTVGWSIDRASSLDDLVLLVSVVALYVASSTVSLTGAQFDRVATAIAAGGVVAATYGIAVMRLGGVTGGRSGVARFALTGRDPNHTAASLLLPMLIAVDRAFDPDRSARERVGWAGGAIVVFVGISLTGSRGGLLATIIGFLVLLRTRVSGATVKAGAVAVAVVVVAVLAFAPPQLERRLASTGTTGRSDIWRLGLRSCEQHCIVGSGWSTFPSVYREEFRQAADVGGFRGEGYRAHNIWLQALVETGLVGFTLLVAAWVALLRQALRIDRSVRAVPLAALAAMAVASSLVSNLTFKYVWLVPMFLGFAARQRPVASAEPEGATATMLASQAG